ncbi:MAG: pilin [Candidatus Saccharimonas sp.]
MRTFLATLLIAIGVFMAPTQAFAACTDSALAIPAWYKGMQSTDCKFDPIKDGNGKPDPVKTAVRIGMNVIQAALVVAGYVAVFMIMKGGFMYMTSAGDPGGMSSAKKSITNAVIGLVIAVLAASIVNAIASLVR